MSGKMDNRSTSGITYMPVFLKTHPPSPAQAPNSHVLLAPGPPRGAVLPSTLLFHGFRRALTVSPQLMLMPGAGLAVPPSMDGKIRVERGCPAAGPGLELALGGPGRGQVISI